MLYVKINELGDPIDQPVTETKLREILNNVSLPKSLTQDILASIGYAIVPEEEPTIVPELGEKVVVDAAKKSGDTYTRVFKTERLSDVEVLARKYKLRFKRDLLLINSDYSQLPDYQAKLTDEQKQKWLDYRETLRNITDQPTFPYSVTWPVSPGRNHPEPIQ